MSVNLRVVPFPQSHCSAYQRKWQCQAVVSTFKHDTVISSFFSAVVRLWYICVKQRQVWWCYSQFQLLQHQGCTCTCIHRAVDDRWSIPACTSLQGRCSEMIRCDLNNNLGPGGKNNDSLIKYINSRLGSMPNALLSLYKTLYKCLYKALR